MTRLSALFSDPIGFFTGLLISLPAILIALTVHEVCHGLVALWCGDGTARSMGRLSLNPFKHLDPIGFVMLLLLGFGFAKPVQVDPRNLKKPRRDMAFVSAAGPLSNLVLGFVFSLLYFLVASNLPYGAYFSTAAFSDRFLYILVQFLQTCTLMNIGLCLFNLIPIPPLDGSKILYAFLPARVVWKIRPYERYGFYILMALLFFGYFSNYLSYATLGIANGFLNLWVAIF